MVIKENGLKTKVTVFATLDPENQSIQAQNNAPLIFNVESAQQPRKSVVLSRASQNFSKSNNKNPATRQLIQNNE